MTVSSAARGATDDHEPASAATRRARQRLEDERQTRTTQLVLIEQEDEDEMRSDAVAAQRATLRRTLAEIEAALTRVDTGDYGICQDCAEPIAHGRLEILPYARCCMPCQQQRPGRR